MENVCEQFTSEVVSIFEHSFAGMCPKLAETSVSEPSEQHGAAPCHKDLFLAKLLLAHQERVSTRQPCHRGKSFCLISALMRSQDNIYFACSDPVEYLEAFPMVQHSSLPSCPRLCPDCQWNVETRVLGATDTLAVATPVSIWSPGYYQSTTHVGEAYILGNGIVLYKKWRKHHSSFPLKRKKYSAIWGDENSVARHARQSLPEAHLEVPGAGKRHVE